MRASAAVVAGVLGLLQEVHLEVNSTMFNLGLKYLNILIIEDNPVNSILLSKLLMKRGYLVSCASSAEEGINAAISDMPELILMDVGLPGMDGLEATRVLKFDPKTRNIPIIAVTAHAMREDSEAAFAAGCDDYTTKPIIIEKLTEKIEKIRVGP